MGWMHAAVVGALRRERGQGTVEYVGLILLLGLVLGAVVAAAKNNDFGLTRLLIAKLKGAISRATELG